MSISNRKLHFCFALVKIDCQVSSSAKYLQLSLRSGYTTWLTPPSQLSFICLDVEKKTNVIINFGGSLCRAPACLLNSQLERGTRHLEMCFTVDTFGLGRGSLRL